jgi:antitoxin component of MazEF toxin-antitoxin module
MQIIRKLIQVGASKAVSLPKSWIESAERNAGGKITALALEVNDTIILQPIFETKKKEDF